MIDIQLEINKLLKYGLLKQLITKRDYYYSANKLISLLGLKEFKEIDINNNIDFYKVLNNIIDYAYDKQLIEEGIVYRDLINSKIMDCLMPRPSEVNNIFWLLHRTDPQKATDYYYNLALNSNYIRQDRISKNIKWKVDSEYGEIDITINLSKPEKDPKVIAKAKLLKNTYPKCLLCQENEGYSGDLNHPARNNHRLIELNLNNKTWFLQYSPYVYYNEHCIVLSRTHEPMKITRNTFKNLFAFVELFPHYFLGSNADLPIVGGSILAHDHFQGGKYEFAMMRQGYKQKLLFDNYPDVEAGIVDWPLSTIRLRSKNKNELIDLSADILNKWREYSDIDNEIIAHTNSGCHNTITPIVRMINDKYEINLVLRNNRTTKQYPDGIFHPHKEHHHIKKENIGLIEVMGLAVLPGRLYSEIPLIKECLLNNKIISQVENHKHWIALLKNKYNSINENNIDDIIKQEIGFKFIDILKQCGVFKDIKSFMKFIKLIK